MQSVQVSAHAEAACLLLADGLPRWLPGASVLETSSVNESEYRLRLCAAQRPFSVRLGSEGEWRSELQVRLPLGRATLLMGRGVFTPFQ